MDKVRIGVVVSEFNREITFPMLGNAKRQAKKMDAIITYVCYVPGSYDMPVIVQELLKKKDVDAAVTLGAVIKGETNHDEIVAENAARLIADLSVKHSKPVALGITGPNMSFKQAKDRSEIVPIRAVISAVNMATRIKKIREENSRLVGKLKIIG
ncbi:MAG: 6,7-dimethyl-8-ribityllumazine synthase [Nitrosopumilales archaeon]|nr:6,7-dimethyl-8-ribityllumazine synthase [Nitrosopumilales archaeon]MRN60562.1 6,7-dimethyl-8-ribityllumazine synthase [Nitrosopumilales archaeon]